LEIILITQRRITMIVELYKKYHHLTTEIEVALRRVGPIGVKAIRTKLSLSPRLNPMCALRSMCSKCEAEDVCTELPTVDEYWVKQMLRNIPYPKIRISCDSSLTKTEQAELAHPDADLEELSVRWVKNTMWLALERVRILESRTTLLVKGGGVVVRRRKADRLDRDAKMRKWEADNAHQQEGEMNFSLPVKAEDTHGTGRVTNTNVVNGKSYDHTGGLR
jgi:hypothetical protein